LLPDHLFEEDAEPDRKAKLTLTRRLVAYLCSPADSFSVPNAFGTWKVC